MIVANLEARFRSPLFPDLVQWTAFADVGEVGTAARPVRTLVSAPCAGRRRRCARADDHRVHPARPRVQPVPASGGAAYFDTPVKVGGALLCVSPGNTLR